MPVAGMTSIYPHTFAVTQFRPAGFIASPLDAGLPTQRCSAAHQLPCGLFFRLDWGLGFSIGLLVGFPIGLGGGFSDWIGGWVFDWIAGASP